MSMLENGKTVDVPERQIEIKKIQLKEYNADTITYEVLCSKGTYIRTLCENIAEKLGTVGHMSSLIRTNVNNFTLEEAISLDDLNEKSKVIRMEEIFKNKESIELDNKKLKAFLNGVQLTYKQKDGIYKIYCQNQFIGLRSN